MAEPLLEIRDLTKHYGAVRALKGINLQVQAGTIYGFIGPNGAGKTTTIRILAGLIRPTRGHSYLDGHDLATDRIPAAEGLRTLVEVPQFYPGLSGHENLSVFGRLARAERGEVDELLEAVGLTEAAKRAVGGYSLGMRQRLGIAQALIGNPRLVVLDEPMNGLDPSAIHLVREIIQTRRREHGVTFFLSSHLLHDVESLCDEVGIIHRGEIVAEGKIDELLSGSISGFRLQCQDSAAALAVLEEKLANAKPHAGEGGHVIVTGDESLLAELNRVLLDAGQPPHSVIPIRETLERYFIEMTEGVMG